MPLAAPRPCTQPGCRALVRGGGPCPAHRRARERERGSAASRGYDARWRRARLSYLHQHPLCVQCEGYGQVVPAVVVDHVVPHRSDTALFWDTDNWQALCVRCHGIKTAREDGGFGTSQALPSGLARPRVPLTVVAGAPGSGKSWWVQQHAGPSDLVLDLDAIRARLSGLSLYEAPEATLWPAMEQRNGQLARLAREDCPWPAAWLVASSPTAAARAWWRRHGARVVVLETPLDVCLARIRADARRRTKAPHEAACRLWHAAYQRSSEDEVVT